MALDRREHPEKGSGAGVEICPTINLSEKDPVRPQVLDSIVPRNKYEKLCSLKFGLQFPLLGAY